MTAEQRAPDVVLADRARESTIAVDYEGSGQPVPVDDRERCPDRGVPTDHQFGKISVILHHRLPKFGLEPRLLLAGFRSQGTSSSW
ncbi:hypothetical protein [Amycolatopsis pithecellobii]|uniref:hypothetical protein n=1 Tax=Amycolatopsis pithecellobii TaxID=664692 RepID=UPI0028ACBCBC|nr:hypothetical protein [Amycolatopsis pithecellobii]